MQGETFAPEGSVLEWLEPRLEAGDHGEARVTIPYRPRVTNAQSDAIHGGVVATALDTACGIAIASELDSASHTTTDLSVSYLRPATDDLTAEAEVVRVGDTMAVARATATTVHEGERTEVAVGRGTFRVFGGE